jgi:hypothetical protein
MEIQCVKTRKLIKAFFLLTISSKSGSEFNITFAKPRRQDYIKCGNRM